MLAVHDLRTAEQYADQVRELYLPQAGLTALPEFVYDLPALKVLDLSGNPIAWSTLQFDRLSQLERLNLTDMHQRSADRDSQNVSFEGLIALRRLDIGHNPYTRLELVSQLPHLEELYLPHNQITSLYLKAGHFPRLRHLDLRGNDIRFLTPDIAQLRSLRHLDLRGNPLTFLPPELTDLPDLETLRLSCDHLHTSLGPQAETTIPQFFARTTGGTLPPAIRAGLFSVLMTDHARLTPPSRELFLASFASDLPGVRKVAPTAWYPVWPDPFAEKIPERVCFRGNLPEMPSAIAQVKLEARGIPVVAAPTGPNCVVVIGDDAELGPEITNNPDIALALPAQLRDFLAREPAPKSTESSHLGPAESGNLRQLLLSDDRDSVRLALNLLEPGALPESLFAELLVQGYFNPEQVISAIVRQFFKRRVPPRTVAFVERYWPFSGSNEGGNQYDHRVQFLENISHLPGLDFPHFLGTLLKATDPEGREQIDLIARRHLVRLPPEQFHPLAYTMIHKQTLNICLLKLKEFPEIFFEFPDLEAIEARDNKLTTLPERIGEFSRLVNLDVRHNKIASVPDRLTQLPRLTRLYLAGNQIQQLPERLGDLAELALLDIGFNQLRSLPRSLIDAPRLRELRCFNAFAQGQIPPVIGELTHLKKLQLSENGITRFPEWQPQFTGLTHLDLSYNPIEQLPDWVGSLPELRVLEINHTQIQELPDSLAGATNLTTIYLPKTIHAGLSSIIRVGQQLPHLRELYFPYRLRTLKHHYRLQKALPQVRIQKHQRRPL